jgi:hypothetical protein
MRDYDSRIGALPVGDRFLATVTRLEMSGGRCLIFQIVWVLHLQSVRRGSRSNAIRIVLKWGKGAHLYDGTGRYHLPLRGKLGWMTP